MKAEVYQGGSLSVILILSLLMLILFVNTKASWAGEKIVKDDCKETWANLDDYTSVTSPYTSLQRKMMWRNYWWHKQINWTATVGNVDEGEISADCSTNDFGGIPITLKLHKKFNRFLESLKSGDLISFRGYYCGDEPFLGESPSDLDLEVCVTSIRKVGVNPSWNKCLMNCN